MEDSNNHQMPTDPNSPNNNNNNNNNISNSNHGSSKTEPVRSRWTPKPEQILILESIFNSGMVNPPKDETVRIRKLLEKFGSVGDANVFYWFQNRRSRSRRRQRQIQASLLNDPNLCIRPNSSSCSSIQFEPTSSSSSSSSSSCFDYPNNNSFPQSPFLVGCGGGSSSSSSCGGGNGGNGGAAGGGNGVGCGGGIGGCGGDDDLFSLSTQMGLSEIEQQCQNVSSILCSSQDQQYQQQAGFVTVFINGVPTDVPNGSLDMKNVFGQDVILVHSSGVPVPYNEFGFSLQSLQMGESYFLVSRSI